MSALARAAAAAQWVVGVAAATAVVLLFSLAGAPEAAEAPASAPTEIDLLIDEGRELYAQFCTSCHGATGQGGQGPRLAGTVVVNYPDAADEIDIVANGRLSMPPFESVLTDDEIAAVVTYTRFGLPPAGPED